MSRHFDRLITAAQGAAAAGPPTRPDPMTRDQIESFIKGFGLSAAATRQIVDKWIADGALNRTTGYDLGYEDGTPCC